VSERFTLSDQAKRALPLLAEGAVPPRGFWQLTEGGIIRAAYPVGASLSELGFHRTPRFRVYSPVTGQQLQRIRLWIAKDVTEEQAEIWIEPYRARPPLNLFEVTPTTYELSRPRKFIYDWKIQRGIAGHLDEIVSKLNKVVPSGRWITRLLIESGERVLISERRIRPSIIMKPSDGRFYGLKEQEFDIAQVEQSAAIVLNRIAQNFPQYASFSRRTERLSEADVARMTREEEED